MRSNSKNIRDIFLIKREFILVAVLLLVILYALAGAEGLESVEAGGQAESEANNTGFGQAASWRTIRMRVTAYCWCWKCCGKHSDGITANGHRIRIGDTFVAADRKYSFGTEMPNPSSQTAMAKGI